MTEISRAGLYKLGNRSVSRMGYGAVQLAGPQVVGPPNDPEYALSVLRTVAASGMTHLDTGDFYGPHVTNQLIQEALHPYRDDPVIVTKVGWKRGADASCQLAMSPTELESAVHDNLRNPGLDVLGAS